MTRLTQFLLLVIWTLMLTTSTQAQGYLFLLSLSYSRNGEYVAGVGRYVEDGEYVAGKEGQVVIWDAETAQIIADITLELETPQGTLIDAAWSPDSERLAVLGSEGRVWMLDFSDDEPPLEVLVTDFAVMTSIGTISIAWSPDGNILVIGGDEITPRLEIRDGATYDYVRSSAFVVGAYRMAWNPDQERNLIATTNGNLNGAQLAGIIDDSRPTWVCSACAPDAIALPLAWNNEGSLLAIGHTDGSIFITDPFTDTVVTQIQAGEYVNKLVWSQNGEYLISLSQDGLQVWDSITGNLLNTPPFPRVAQIAVHPLRDDLFIYTGVGTIIRIDTLLQLSSTPTPTVTPTLSPTPSPTFTPTPTPPPFTVGIYRAVQMPGSRVTIERALSAGLDTFDTQPNDDGWTQMGRTNGAGENGTLRSFTVLNDIPYAAVQHASKGCIVITPNTLEPRRQGQTRFVRIVAQQATARCNGDWSGFAP